MVLLLVVMMINCAEIYIESPMKSDVRLMAETEPGVYTTHMRCFYLFWGLIPISDNSTSTIIARYNLSQVKARTHYGLIDWLISGLTGGILFSMSVDVEGKTESR